MARITIASRLQAAPELAGFLDAQGPRLAAGLDLRLFGENGSSAGSGLGGGGGVLEALRGLRQSVLEAGQELYRRDEEVRARTCAARGVRRQRDEAAARLRTWLIRSRGFVEAAYGPAAVEDLLGIRGNTSEDPLVLLRQGRRAQVMLERAEAPASELIRSFENTVVAVTDHLAREGDALEAALSAVVHARGQEQASTVARQQAVRDFDALFLPAHRWLVALCELSGMAEHAPLIPTAKKRASRRSPSLRGKGLNPVSLPAASSSLHLPPLQVPSLSLPSPRRLPAPSPKQ